MYSIANKYGLSASELKSINNLTTNNLSIGQVLKVRKSIDVPVDNSNYYIVKSGDSLYKIANTYNISVNELKKLNNLTTNNLSIGQKLIIPTKKENQVYTVKNGDTLYSIAREFNTTVSDIQSLNNLVTSNLNVGEKLLIP